MNFEEILRYSKISVPCSVFINHMNNASLLQNLSQPPREQ